MSNKGYYSWIHTLKSAAMDARAKGIQMVNEEKAKKVIDPSKQAALQKQLTGQTPAPVAINPDDKMPEKPTADPKDVKAAFSGLGKTTAHSIALADGDVGAYVNTRRMKHAEKLAQMASQTGPVDAKPAGDAKDVEDDAQDGVMADPDLTDFEDEMAQAAEIRKHALANRARREAEGYYDEPPANDYDYEVPTAEWRTVKESLSSKISRILNEENPKQKGTMQTGPSAEVPDSSPPNGFFSREFNDQQRLGKILSVINNPDDHPADHVAYAREALDTIQRQLR